MRSGLGFTNRAGQAAGIIRENITTLCPRYPRNIQIVTRPHLTCPVWSEASFPGPPTLPSGQNHYIVFLMHRVHLVLDAANVDDNLGEVPLVVHDDLHTRLHHLHGAVK